MLAELIESFNFDYKKLSFRIPVIVIFLVFLIRTQMYIPVFENHSTFWSNLPKTYPDRQIAYAIAGGVLFNENFVDESLKLLTDGENAPIKNTTLYFNLATVNMSRNNFEKVEYYSKKGLEIDSNNSKLYVKWAISKLKMMDTAGSIEKYGKAIEKNSKNTEALSNLSLIYMMKKDVPNAIKYLEISIAVDKSNSNNFNNLGVCYFNSGNKQKAEEAWLEAVKNPKLNNDAYNNLIMFYTKSNISKSLELANELSKRGGKLKPELRKALYGN